MKRLFYVAIDVDDKAFHVAIISTLDNEIKEFKCAPNITSLTKKLEKQEISKDEMKICYEASHLGFSLYRALKQADYNCEVIAPSLIPELPGKKQKTDRVDARKLAQFYKKGLLTPVHVPNYDDQMDRDLIRSRRVLVDQATKLKNRIVGIGKTLGWNFRQETRNKSYWTKSHLDWLEKKMNGCKSPSLRFNLKMLLDQLQHTLDNISIYETEIENLSAQLKYRRKVQALNCYRGISTNTSMLLITELGDINRFTGPTNLFSYGGFDLIEYSSGGRETKYSISKDGNKYVRAAVVEASQYVLQQPRAGKYLKERRAGAEKEFIDIADRCMLRLHKKGSRMLYKGKHRNKIKVACAREMLGFVWESLRKAS